MTGPELKQLREHLGSAIGRPLSATDMAKWLNQVNDPNLHLVGANYDKALQDDYLPAQLTAEDYPNLISRRRASARSAAEAILASYNSGNDRYRRVALLVESLFSNTAKLQRPPFHPKCQELALMAPVAGWTRFKAAQDWIDRKAPAAAVAAAPSALGAHASSLNPDDQALYREFLEWKTSRQKPRR